MRQVGIDRNGLRWLISLGLAAALHLAVWWGYAHFKSETIPSKPLPPVQVTLLAPHAPPQPLVTPQPRVEPRPVTKATPVPTPVPAPQPVAEQAVRQAPAAVVPPPPPMPALTRPAPEAVIEPPRYNAAYLSNPPPAYPLVARRRGIEGAVLVRVEVAASGECLRAELKKSSGHDALDQAALEAVKKWRFVPARSGTQAVAAWVDVPISFKLDNN